MNNYLLDFSYNSNERLNLLEFCFGEVLWNWKMFVMLKYNNVAFLYFGNYQVCGLC